MPKQLMIPFRHIVASAHKDWGEVEFLQLLDCARPGAAFVVARTDNEAEISQRINLFVALHRMPNIESGFGIESRNECESAVLN